IVDVDFKRRQPCHSVGRRNRDRQIAWHSHHHSCLQIESRQIGPLHGDGDSGGCGGSRNFSSRDFGEGESHRETDGNRDAAKRCRQIRDVDFRRCRHRHSVGRRNRDRQIARHSRCHCRFQIKPFQIRLLPCDCDIRYCAFYPSSVSMLANGPQRLVAIFTPENASDKAVTWTSSNETVAAVASDGLVTAKAIAGTATITVKSTNRQTISATCLVTVTTTSVAVTGISVEPVTLSLEAGAERQLRADVAPPGATNQNVTYVSSASLVASVSETGLVRALGAGTAVITVTSVSDATKTAGCEVTVTAAPVAVASISVEPVTLTLTTGAERQLRAVVTPENATNQNVTYVSSVPSVASVSGTGLVRALGAGTAVITATSVSDATKTASCAVTVTAAPVAVAGISVDPVTLTLATGAARQLRAVVTPENATNQNVTYVSSVSSVASVSGTGLVRALTVGTTTITVTSESNPSKTATCAVTVLSNDASVSAIALGDENFP